MKRACQLFLRCRFVSWSTIFISYAFHTIAGSDRPNGSSHSSAYCSCQEKIHVKSRPFCWVGVLRMFCGSGDLQNVASHDEKHRTLVLFKRPPLTHISDGLKLPFCNNYNLLYFNDRDQTFLHNGNMG